MGILQSRRLKTIMFGLLTVLSSFVVGYGIAMTARSNFSAPLPPGDLTLALATPSATPAPRRTAVLAAEDVQERSSLDEPTITSSSTSLAQATLTPGPTMPAATITAPSSTAPAQPTAVLSPTTFAQSEPTSSPLRPSQATATPLERFVSDSFDSSAGGWLVRDGTRSSAGYVDGRYRLTLTGQTDLGVSLALRGEAYQLSADVTVRKGGAGLVFLSEKPTTFYRFIITNDGAYAIQSRAQDAAPANLAGWSESAALRRGPAATNRLRLERSGVQVRCYANDQLLTVLTLPDQPFTSQYGFALTAADGLGEASFDNLIGEYLPQP
jgi:hypothetical protein